MVFGCGCDEVTINSIDKPRRCMRKSPLCTPRHVFPWYFELKCIQCIHHIQVYTPNTRLPFSLTEHVRENKDTTASSPSHNNLSLCTLENSLILHTVFIEHLLTTIPSQPRISFSELKHADECKFKTPRIE